MNVVILLGIYCLLIVFGSLAGGWLPSLLRLTHARMQLMMSLVAGLMLGVGLLHMLPHAAAQTSIDQAAYATLAGLLVMFFLIRTFDFHQHAPVGEKADRKGEGHGHHGGGHRHQLSWLGVALGLSLHTAIDGMALVASVETEVALAESVPAKSNQHAGFSLWGLGTFLAILLHKPLDALSITSLMAAGGWSVRRRQLVNAGFAMMCPIGAFLAFFGLNLMPDNLVGWALGFAAGCFLCISLGDLLPELHFHTHDRVKLSVLLLLGVLMAYGIGRLENARLHVPGVPHHHGHEH